MTKAASLLLLAFAWSPAMAAQDQPGRMTMPQALRDAAPGAQSKCDNDDPHAVVVCGRSQAPYRIDPNVLAATRAAEAPPPKPPVGSAPPEQCTGPNCGGGSYVPLVGMAYHVPAGPDPEFAAVDVLAPGSHPDTRSVRAANVCRIALHRPPERARGASDTLVVLSVIDNLVKGAAGQAIQNMNLMFGLPETQGLLQPALVP